MKVPFLNLRFQYEEIEKEVKTSLENIFKKGDFILGENVLDFQKYFAEYCKVKYAVGVNSGTDALFLALKALGVKEGDEVIVPAFTYIASAFAVTYTSAVPVFCDIEEDTYNINYRLIEEKITKKTKAIMPVHLYGHFADIKPIMEIAQKHSLKVIEDCAQAHGACYKPENKKAGAFGDAGCYSFYPTKNLGAYGDAGMAVTNNEDIFKSLIKLRDYGRRSRYYHNSIGYNSRLDTVQAAVLKAKLKRLDKWNNLRRQAAVYYSELLSDCKYADIVVPVEKKYAEHVYHVYGIRVPSKIRDRLVDYLKDNDVGVIIHYPVPLHLQEVYKKSHSMDTFPVSEKTASEIISLPIFPGIKKVQIEYVCQTIKKAFKHL